MVRLANCSNIQYKDNIGGLLQTCNDFESFQLHVIPFQNKDILVSICLFVLIKIIFDLQLPNLF